MKQKKKLFVLVVTLFMAVTLLGCSGAPEPIPTPTPTPEPTPTPAPIELTAENFQDYFEIVPEYVNGRVGTGYVASYNKNLPCTFHDVKVSIYPIASGTFNNAEVTISCAYYPIEESIKGFRIEDYKITNDAGCNARFLEHLKDGWNDYCYIELTIKIPSDGKIEKMCCTVQRSGAGSEDSRVASEYTIVSASGFVEK